MSKRKGRKAQVKKRKCHQIEIGNKRRFICDDDNPHKRMFVKADVFKHLEDCKEVNLDGKRSPYVYPDFVNDSIQRGRVRKVRCTRRTTGRDCWQIDIQGEQIPLCRDDSSTKKVDILDATDSVLAGCSKVRLTNPDGSTAIMRRVGGLNITQRNIAGRMLINGQARGVRCIAKTKRGEQRTEMVSMGG